jgi:hypothetical protein
VRVVVGLLRWLGIIILCLIVGHIIAFYLRLLTSDGLFTIRCSPAEQSSLSDAGLVALVTIAILAFITFIAAVRIPKRGLYRCLAATIWLFITWHLVPSVDSPIWTHDSGGVGESAVLALGRNMTFLLLVLCGVVALLCRRYKCDSRLRRRGSIVAVVLLVLVYLAWDESRPEPIYSYSDLKSPFADARESSDVLMAFKRDGGLKMTIEVPYTGIGFPSNVIESAEAIETAWKQAQPGWQIIEKLDEFDEISDFAVEDRGELDRNFLGSWPLRTIGRSCWRYAMLKTMQGDSEEGVARLCKMHSVVRKSIPYATPLINKMIFVAILEDSVKAAYQVAATGECSEQALAMLSETFSPLFPDAVSMARPYVAEYLYFLKGLETDMSAARILYVTEMMKYYDNGKIAWPEKGCPGWISTIVSPFILNRNKTLRLHSEMMYRLLIAESSELPPATSRAEAMANEYCEGYPNIKNPVGGLAVLAAPAWLKAYRSAWRSKVSCDLLALHLARLTGKELELIDHFTAKPYQWDEATNLPYSVGWDRQPGTDDDIRLGKWPS